MRRATITVPDALDRALEDFIAAQPARPSLTSVVEAALAHYLQEPAPGEHFTSRIVDVVRNRQRLVELARARGAVRIGLFGSVAQARDTAGSDVDFWVEVGPTMGLFELAALRYDLAEELGCEVDVLTLGGLDARAREELITGSLVL